MSDPKTVVGPRIEDLPRLSLQHQDERLSHSLVGEMNMETMLAVHLAQAHAALRAVNAALRVAPKSIQNHASVQSALAIIDDALP